MHLKGYIMTLGEKIKAARLKRGWTVKQLIERLGNSISSSYISKIEIEGEIPSPKMLKSLSRVLELKYDTLATYAKEEKLQQFKKGLAQKYEQ